MRRPASILAIVAAAAFAGRADAADMIVYDGHCSGSHVKSGPDEADLTKLAGSPIDCDVAVLLTALPNGHAIMQFSMRRGEKIGPLGFGGPGVSHTINQNFAVMPIEHVYPRRQLGASPEETYAEAAGRKPLDGEGACLFDGQDIVRTRQLSCVSKVEAHGQKTVFTVKFAVRHASVERGLANDFSFSR